MERRIGQDNIILLCDSYSPDSKRLHECFQQADIDCLVVVMEEDYFLPEGVVSVYDFLFYGSNAGKENTGKPKYFNEIPVPDTWEMSAGTGKFGKILYRHEEKGRIYYAEYGKKYLVKTVDWFDRKGIVRFSDHYNRCGRICARSIYNARGHKINKTWFSKTGQEVIVKNYVTGNIILNDGSKVEIFERKMDIIHYFFKKFGFQQYRIFYNSLATPFFVSQNLDVTVKGDVLFWQEPIGDEIPGNMQIILSGKSTRTAKIMVQKRQSYEKLLALGAKKSMLYKLGYLYPFKRKNGYCPEVLICTNSDEIAHCREIIEALPEMHFHIAALTAMSQKLMEMGEYKNVNLYPAIEIDVLEKLFQTCDFYFDINYWDEIVSAVQKAFLYNHLIFAFEETIHNREFVADVHIYSADNFNEMISDVRAVMRDKKLFDRHLKKQHEAAMAEDKEEFTRYF